MKKATAVLTDNEALLAVLKELNAIKRLLALSLLRDGVPQQAVAKAAGVATLKINQLANTGGPSRKTQNGRVK